MKQIINGKMYDTQDSECLETLNDGELYKTHHGEYFIYREYAKFNSKQVIKLVTEVEAFNWLQYYGFDDSSNRIFPDLYCIGTENDL